MNAGLTPYDLQNMTVDDLLAALTAHQDGLIIEDEWGARYTLVRMMAIGRRTTDPGLVFKVRRLSQHPDA